jgi:hypothetical protein
MRAMVRVLLTDAEVAGGAEMITVGGAEMHGAGRGEPSADADLAIRVPAFTRRMGFSGDFRCHPHFPPHLRQRNREEEAVPNWTSQRQISQCHTSQSLAASGLHAAVANSVQNAANLAPLEGIDAAQAHLGRVAAELLHRPGKVP